MGLDGHLCCPGSRSNGHHRMSLHLSICCTVPALGHLGITLSALPVARTHTERERERRTLSSHLQCSALTAPVPLFCLLSPQSTQIQPSTSIQTSIPPNAHLHTHPPSHLDTQVKHTQASTRVWLTMLLLSAHKLPHPPSELCLSDRWLIFQAWWRKMDGHNYH